jgi:hypothetical protein
LGVVVAEVPRGLLDELRWSFTLPMAWLQGVGANLVLSLLWLLWVPLTGRTQEDWVIVVGSYFATFVLADVTTTNVLGPDTRRVLASLAAGEGIRRILLRKNAALLIVVALPTLVLTAVLTVTSEDSYRLAVTLPGVAFPIFCWLGVGNVVSVLLPVRSRPLLTRWRQRRELTPTLWWLFHLGLPYVLWYAVTPLGAAPRAILRGLARASRTVEVKGLVLTATGVAIWVVGTIIAERLARARGLQLR